MDNIRRVVLLPIDGTAFTHIHLQADIHKRFLDELLADHTQPNELRG